MKKNIQINFYSSLVFFCVAIILVSVFAFSFNSRDPEIQKITPIYKKKEAIHSGDWLAVEDESFCSLECYKGENPIRADSVRKFIYIYKLDENTRSEDSLVSVIRTYLEYIYHLKTKAGLTFPFSCVPDTMKRGHGEDAQVQTHFIMDTLIRVLPADGVVALCITKHDLYPNESMSFVFGQAYNNDRTGICSFYRHGYPDKPAEFSSVLRRIVKTASHETGHMFTLSHCVRYECVMNGSNSLSEADMKPMHFCPDCLEKLKWNRSFNLKGHFTELQTFYRRYGFNEEAAFLARNLKMLQ